MQPRQAAAQVARRCRTVDVVVVELPVVARSCSHWFLSHEALEAALREALEAPSLHFTFLQLVLQIHQIR